MLNAIIRFSLRYRPLIVVCSLVCLVYGGYMTTRLPLDVLPNLDRPRVVVMTECPGLATLEVETLVSYPLEAAVLGATGVRDVRSESAAGLSIVTIEFDWDADIHRARQVVQERLSAVQQDLPAGIRPQMAPISSILGQIMVVGIYSQPGPRGGVLAPLGATGKWAELVYRPEEGVVSVFLWQGGTRESVKEWEPFLLDAREAELTAEEPEGQLPDAKPARTANGASRLSLVLPRAAGTSNEFTAR